jgi:hypothetical protein
VASGLRARLATGPCPAVVAAQGRRRRRPAGPRACAAPDAAVADAHAPAVERLAQAAQNIVPAGTLRARTVAPNGRAQAPQVGAAGPAQRGARGQ